jgi:hypothetical protein
MSFIINPYSFSAAGGGGVLPTDLSSDLELWLPVSALSALSNDDQITTQFLDQSGNGNDPTGAVGVGQQPIYKTTGGPTGGPRVELSNGSNGRWFTLPNFLTSFTAGEVFVVLAINADPPADTSHSGPPLGDWGTPNTGLYPYFGDSKIYEGWGSTVRKDATKDPDTALTSWHVYNIRSAAGAYSWRINGAASGNDFFSTATNTVGWGTAPQIGRGVTGFGANCYCSFADIIFASRILDDTTERKAVIHQYLNDEYGFSLPT